MADSDVVRARRRRQHLRGDHSECGSRCVAQRVEAASAARAAGETVTDAVAAFTAAVAPWPDDDPRRVILATCREFAGRLDAGDGDRLMADFVVQSVRSLAVDPAAPADYIDELNARGAARQLERIARLPVRPSAS